MSDLVTTEVDGSVLLVGVDRAHKRNAWNREIIAAVADAYTRLRDDDALRVGVVFGHGADFSAGLDLADVLPVLAEGGSAAQLIGPEHPDPFDLFNEPCPKPVVLAAQGRCYTLGIELILASQAAVVAADTVFAQLEVARGIVPFGGGGHRLPALGKRGMQALLTAETFDAAQALEMGMVSEVVETGRQLDRAVEIAQQMAANAPLAVRAALANTRAAERPARRCGGGPTQSSGRSALHERGRDGGRCCHDRAAPTRCSRVGDRRRRAPDRPSPGADPVRDRAGPVHDLHGRHHHERGAPLDPVGLRRGRVRPAVGGGRVQPDHGDVHDDLCVAGGQPRSQARGTWRGSSSSAGHRSPVAWRRRSPC